MGRQPLKKVLKFYQVDSLQKQGCRWIPVAVKSKVPDSYHPTEETMNRAKGLKFDSRMRQNHMTSVRWPIMYFVRWPACTLKITNQWLLNLKLLLDSAEIASKQCSPNGRDTCPALLAPLALPALKVSLNTTWKFTCCRK